MIEIICLVVALVFFGIAFFQWPAVQRFSLVAGGLFFWVLGELFGKHIL